MDPFPLVELYKKIEENKIPAITADFKAPVQKALVDFGTEVKNKKKVWRKMHPVALIDEINAAIHDTFPKESGFDETSLSIEEREELDNNRQLRVIFYRIRRFIRNVLKEGKQDP